MSIGIAILKTCLALMVDNGSFSAAETPIMPSTNLYEGSPGDGEAAEASGGGKGRKFEGEVEGVRTKPTSGSEIMSGQVTNKEVEAYQRREIGKNLLLLQNHFQQGCKIPDKDGVPRGCDCCVRHPMEIEALAQETIAIVPDNKVFVELADWVRKVEPISITAISI
jgi:hypothetical protein